VTQIAIVTYPGFTGLDMIGPYEVLRNLPDAWSTPATSNGADQSHDHGRMGAGGAGGPVAPPRA
jgi:putative intracellular protease/amidase